MADQNPTGADRPSHDPETPAADDAQVELRPFEPVPDALVLAAVKRAEHHHRKGVPHRFIAAHLGFVPSSATTRRLRPQLEGLRAAGSLERTRKRGQDQWGLTPVGGRRLAAARRAGKVGKLPESPQHRRWREARSAAEGHYDEFRTLVYVTLETAEDAAQHVPGPDSETWHGLGRRLAAAFWLMGSVTYCRDEWSEPDDACADRDDALGELLGRRNFEDWERYEVQAKGGLR